MHIYVLKIAAAFMITTHTLAINTQLTARWIAFLGYASAVFVLGFCSFFPHGSLLVSVLILRDNLWGSATRREVTAEGS